MNKTALLILIGIVVALASGFTGYSLKQEEQLLVEGLSTHHLLTRSYENINPIYPALPEDTSYNTYLRTVSKDRYIEWLEDALVEVQKAEVEKRVDLANKHFKRIREAKTRDSLTPPLSDKERDASLQRIANLYIEATAYTMFNVNKPANRHNSVNDTTTQNELSRCKR